MVIGKKYVLSVSSRKRSKIADHSMLDFFERRIELETKFAEQLEANHYLTEITPVGICRMVGQSSALPSQISRLT
jgi:hypothetical protein